MTNDKEMQIECMKEMEAFDTPTVTNAVATYPDRESCLGLYEPHETPWFTDERLRCLYPALEPRCGFAVTCVYGLPNSNYSRLGFGSVLEALAAAGGPAVLVMKLNMPENLRRKNALIGGNMLTACKQAGAVGVIGDGPARDLEEMRPLQVQCLFSGLTAGHGPLSVAAVNTPVEVCSMAVAPGEVIHMDGNGAVKFPAQLLPEVLTLTKQIAREDEERQAFLRAESDPKRLSAIMKGLYK